jgi:uncharacterized protein YutE (UPF0331/DUF86 family)
MTTFIIEKIIVKIGNLKQYLNYLSQLSKEIESEEKYENDFRLIGNTERYLQLSAQCVIDVCQLIAVEESIKMVGENREIVSELRGRRIITEKTASNLTKMVGMRNVLVHEYGEIDNKMVYETLKNNMNDFEDFIEEIKKYFNK